ncbi:hypothetical protein WME76_24665 [Sorangium sp. So ce119]
MLRRHGCSLVAPARAPNRADLRFTVTPSAGAWYRYTGACIEYVPVP